ncbi:MAG: methyl-accepting chemotaxis protein [Nitrospirales bacterium]
MAKKKHSKESPSSNERAELTMNDALTSEKASMSLFDQLGGSESVTAAVSAFYQRVLHDPLLIPFFVNVDIPTLQSKQVLFFTQALGGPAVYNGPPMKPAHAHLAIKEQHFLRVAEHLVETLKSLNVPASVIDEVIALIGPLASDIVNTPAPKGHTPQNESLPSQKGENVMGTSEIQGSTAVMDAPAGQKDIAELSSIVAAMDKSQAMIEFHMDGTIITANENFLQTVGYTLSEIQGQHHRMFAEPAYAASPEYGNFWAKLNRGEFDAGQYRRIGKGGKEVWIQASYNPVFDVNDKPYKVVKFATNITEFKIQNQEYEARNVAVGNGNAVIDFTPDGIILDANENFLKTLDYTLDEIKGKHHRMFADPEFAASPEYTAFWEKLRRGEYDAGHYRRIAKGGKEIWIQASYNPIIDENGKTYKVVKFAMDITEAKRAEIRAARVSNMMENAPVNVLFADKDLRIKYANPASIKTLKTIEQHLPCKVDDLIGQNIDIFHKNPAHQRNLLKDPKNLPHRANINVGPEVLDLLVSAIYDNNQNYLGPMVTWEVVTEKLKNETEMARVMSMMENAPINVMCADLDLKIQYMNPASTKTLKSLESLLPIKVDQMIGHSIDVFHKVPDHQRQLLANPKNLPHQAHIRVGDETLDLLVSAIYDNKQNYLGPMVTWEVITEKLKQEEAIKEANEKEKAQAAKLKEGVSEVADISTTLASASEELTSVSNTMGAAAEETSSQATVVSAAAGEVSKNVQSVATGSEELSASFKEIAKNTTEAAKVASEAVSVAEETNMTVGKLGESSAEIGSIIKVITSIAQQTNLLALNATIEAARAGEAGKGFAVVANEVKELAKETTKATENIGKMIETIQGDTKGAVDAIGHIGGIIKQVNDFMNTIASAVEEQLATTNEMTRNVTQASQGTDEIASNILNVAEAAKGTAEGAVQTQTSAAELSKMAANLQSVVQTLTALQ